MSVSQNQSGIEQIQCSAGIAGFSISQTIANIDLLVVA
jgi:hypothetical protein